MKAKNRFAISLAVVLAITLTAAIAWAERGRPFRERCSYWENYGQEMFKGDPQALEGVVLDGRTPFPSIELPGDAQPYLMILGPKRYWDAKGIELAEGEAITVFGYFHPDRPTLDHIVIVSKVVQGDKEIILRDDDGRPKWIDEMRKGRRDRMRSDKRWRRGGPPPETPADD